MQREVTYSVTILKAKKKDPGIWEGGGTKHIQLHTFCIELYEKDKTCRECSTNDSDEKF